MADMTTLPVYPNGTDTGTTTPPAGTATPTGTNPTATPSGTGALASAAGLGPADYSADKLNTLTGATTGATSYTPDDSALVSKNLTKLISGDSDYMTLARTKAAQYANTRGLLNSSIGAGAGESAAIEAALPIAQGDANVNAAAQATNANAKNTFALDANQFQRQGALAAVGAGYTASQMASDQGFKGTQAELDRGLKDTEFNKDLSLRTTQTANDLTIKDATLQQEMQRQYMDARTTLETTPNLDQAGKANAINAMSDWFYSDALPRIRAELGHPDAWPGPVTAPPSGGTPGTPGAGPGVVPPSAHVNPPAPYVPPPPGAPYNTGLRPGDPGYDPTQLYGDAGGGGGGGGS